MKKMIMLGTVVLVMLLAAACGKKNKTEVTETTSSPMSMLSDDGEFVKQLGFGIDSTKLPVHGVSRFVINGKLAQIRFVIEVPGKEQAVVTLRATKDPETAQDLSGLSGTESEPVTETVSGVSVTRKDITVNGTVHSRYFFEKDGVQCCLVIQGELEKDTVVTLLNSVFDALITNVG